MDRGVLRGREQADFNMRLQDSVKRVKEEFELDPKADEDVTRVATAGNQIILKGRVDRCLVDSGRFVA